MRIKTLIPSILFVVVSVLHVIGLKMDYGLAFATKPMIMITLIVLYVAGTSRFRFLYFFGMVFSLIGDVLLDFDDWFFMYGLIAFLLAHVCYIAVSSKFLPKISALKVLIHSLPFLAIYGTLLYIIYPNLGGLLIPVIVYGVVISTFGIIAFLVYTQNKSKENLWLFLGAFIFIISDSILALNKFHESSEFLSLAIMITYIFAQYLICRAMIERSK